MSSRTYKAAIAATAHLIWNIFHTLRMILQAMDVSNLATSVESPPCYLLKLPTELQLDIYELVVVENKPLLTDFACNSSYRGYTRRRLGNEEERAWGWGDRKPPMQPALTRTCRFIRANALPLFYKKNVFRASYCHIYQERGISRTVTWLRMIGPQNREMLRHFYFYDRNEDQDTMYSNSHELLQALKDSAVFTELGGKMETLSSKDCCAHLVTFGEYQRNAREVPIALEPGVPKLRIEGEV